MIYVSRIGDRDFLCINERLIIPIDSVVKINIGDTFAEFQFDCTMETITDKNELAELGEFFRLHSICGECE